MQSLHMDEDLPMACFLVCRISMFCLSHCTALGSCSPSLHFPIGPVWPQLSLPDDLLSPTAARVDGPHCLGTNHQNLQRERAGTTEKEVTSSDIKQMWLVLLVLLMLISKKSALEDNEQPSDQSNITIQ